MALHVFIATELEHGMNAPNAFCVAANAQIASIVDITLVIGDCLLYHLIHQSIFN